MYLAPEVYYRTVYRENERELERRLAYRRAAEQDPQRVVRRDRTGALTRVVTALGSFVAARRRPQIERETRPDAAAGGTLA